MYGTDHSKVNISYRKTMRNCELQIQNDYDCLTIGYGRYILW